jgi:hypothetical protein
MFCQVSASQAGSARAAALGCGVTGSACRRSSIMHNELSCIGRLHGRLHSVMNPVLLPLQVDHTTRLVQCAQQPWRCWTHCSPWAAAAGA